MRRIDLEKLQDGRRRALVDGQPWLGDFRVGGNIDSGLKVGIWLDGQRVYDAEYYSDGKLVAVIPPQEPWVDMAYGVLEGISPQ